MNSKERGRRAAFRDWITLGAALVLIVTAFVWGMRCGADHAAVPRVLLHDSLRIRELVADTVLRWRERVVFKEVEPETVYLYADTIAPDTVWGRWPEAIVALDCIRGNLSFTSLLPLGDTGKAVLKEYSYRVGERFAVRSKGEGFHVRTNRLRPRLQVGVGSELKLTGDTAAVRIVPFVSAGLGWRGLSVGPRLDTRGLHLSLEYEWRW